MFIISKKNLFTEDKKYPDYACKEIFDAIGISLTLADKECEKTKNEEKTKLGKKRKMMGKALFFSLAAANYASSYEIVLDNIIPNVVIWMTQDIPEFGGFYKNGEFCSGECEEIKLKYIRKIIICLRHKEYYTIMVIIGLKHKR